MSGKQTTFSTDALAKAGVDLHLDVTGPRLRVGLTTALRDAVRSGRLVPGTRLPASRALAADLGIARSTVTECYSELVAEGWLVARHGSGTRVADRVQPMATLDASRTQAGPRAAHRLEPGAGDYADFPRTPWLAAARRVFAAAPHSAFGYGDPLGLMDLRVALANYLSRVRGVYADPEQIVITSGFHHGLGIIARALKSVGAEAVAVESYGLDIYRGVLDDEGLAIPPLAVDEHGARVEDLGLLANQPAAVLLTPAHQFPTGYALSAERKASVLEWARRAGGVILEDDYDGEFRYDRRPIGALQGLAPEHVVYFGTASKSIAPALRLGWMVVPKRLLSVVAEAKGRVETVSVLDQLILTEFVASGSFDRHVRGRRLNYRRRRTELVEAVAATDAEVEVVGMAAGLQAVLTLPAGTEAWVLQAAARQGLVVGGLAEFRHPEVRRWWPATDAIVVNFAAVSDSAWPGAVRALCSVLP
jgi:GntR family transcriptional regulator/MocR family aminotransferase